MGYRSERNYSKSCVEYSENEVLIDAPRNEEFTEVRVKGLGIVSATLFIIGEMAGSGVLALPRALVNTGNIGIVLLIVFCLNAAYGGIRLGNCWNMVEQRFPEHRKATRNPYAIVAEKAIGKFGSHVVSICIRITLFGAGTVYLLLASQIIQELLRAVVPELSTCLYFLLISILITPVLWLSSPKDFSLVGVGAVLTIVCSCILFNIQIFSDAKTIPTAPRQVHGFHDFFISSGMILFSFGGASTFPTIQNDMKNRKDFSMSVAIAFIIIMLLYFPITIGGFLVYGEGVNINLTLSMTKNLMVDLGNILIAIHLIFAFLIVLNPVFQDVEESFQLPKRFHWKRCVFRSLVMVFVIFVGESVPQFGKILALIGGSTITMTTFVFPPLFYMKLCDQENPNWPKKVIPLHERVYIWELIVIGLIGGCASTYSAIISIFGAYSFTRPCY
ncbi:unnamed protein product [Phaedon cochleariae]|uniref:Amino acid transporter transmembrane domain-containing protein n=1 Tax=Phaedon cochleariae TaxID=80249 RepID=A0A9P0GTT2_PHACE|nr:unnamed protein product [Phaedon cochleariae]